ncbi:hypothetical protein [Escherichia phage PJNS034]
MSWNEREYRKPKLGTVCVHFEPSYKSTFGSTKKFPNASFYLSTNGVIIIRDMDGDNICAYPEGVWLNVEMK